VLSYLTGSYGLIYVLLEAAVLLASLLTVGGLVFRTRVASPLAPLLGRAGRLVAEANRRRLMIAALVAACAGGLKLQLQIDMVNQVLLPGAPSADTALFAQAGLTLVVACLVTALVAYLGQDAKHPSLASGLIVIITAATALASHGVGRVTDQELLTLLTGLHFLGAAIWIGALPFYAVALDGVGDGVGIRRYAERFTPLALFGGGAMLLGAAGLAYHYIDSPWALYGTGYGQLALVKGVLFLGLIVVGIANALELRRLRVDPNAPMARVQRSIEIEALLGLVLVVTAASMSALPPSVDLPSNRLTVAAIADHFAPRVRDITRLDQFGLPLPGLIEEGGGHGRPVFGISYPAEMPGGLASVTLAQDLGAWSTFNHRIAGLIVLLMAFLACLELTDRAPIGHHWPLLLPVLAAFLFVNSHPEAWPLGEGSFVASILDAGVVRDRLAVLLLAVLAAFEWGVRTGRITGRLAARVFPIALIGAAALMLVQAYPLVNVPARLLHELAHLPMILLAIAAGVCQWLELGLPPRSARVPALVWRGCYLLIGLLLVVYRAVELS